MSGLKAFNFILRVYGCCMMLVSIHHKRCGMYVADTAADVTGLGIPRYDITDFESL